MSTPFTPEEERQMIQSACFLYQMADRLQNMGYARYAKRMVMYGGGLTRLLELWGLVPQNPRKKYRSMRLAVEKLCRARYGAAQAASPHGDTAFPTPQAPHAVPPSDASGPWSEPPALGGAATAVRGADGT